MKKITQVISKEYIEEFLSTRKHYGPKSLVFCVIDSVFSIGVKYESVIKVVERFSKHAKLDIDNDEYTLEQFIEDYGDYDYETLANDIFKNRQRTSTRSGILKSEAVVRYIRVLNSFRINTTDDLLNYSNIDEVKKAIFKIPGQGSGVSFSYVMMLAGDTSLFKPDRQIYDFFENYLGYGRLNESQLRERFHEQYQLIHSEYPVFTIRLLDSLIWTFMKNIDKIVTKIKVIDSNLPFFMTDTSWYYFDEDSYRFYLTEKATSKAVESYNRFYDFKK